jgi:hypothetical protein
MGLNLMIFPHALTATVCILVGTRGARRPWFTGMGANESCELCAGGRSKPSQSVAPAER